MKYVIINSDENNGIVKKNIIFYAAPVLSGAHIGKFATSENALKEFPEIFESLDYEVAELSPRDFSIDTTPPPLSGYGVIIPSQFLWAFPNDKFILHGTGFEIPLTQTSQGKAVDAAYLEWPAFLAEIWKPEHQTVFDILEPVWLYCEQQADARNFVQLI
jgi:hypothetical protein